MTLVSIPANPVPDGAVTGTLKTPDGVSLRFARWEPPPGRKGTVCLFQGRSEFIEKYFETVRDLRARGFAVATFDWRGQGLSDRALGNRRKGYVRNFAQYQIDLDTFINEIVLPDCPPPLFALAQSMGATVLLQAAHAGLRWFDRIVLLSPMIALPGMRRLGATRALVRSMRLAGLGERETLVHMRADPAIRDALQQYFHPGRDHIGFVPHVAEVHAEDRFVCVHQKERMEQRHAERSWQQTQRSRQLRRCCN